MTIHLVANPTSGGGRAARMLPRVVEQLRRTFVGRPLVVQKATNYAHARQVINDAVACHTEDEVLVVLGGDGMMHLGLNAVAGTDVPLGMIAAGSGDDLCRGLGIDVDDPGQALELIGLPARPIDLLRVDPLTPVGPNRGRGDDSPVSADEQQRRWVGSILCSGFDALVNIRANAMTFPRGRLQYPVAVFTELRDFQPLRYELVVDGERRELEAMLIAIGNTSSFGGGLRMCPDADPDDGLLDITIIHPVGRAKLVRMFGEVYAGTFTRIKEVELIRARRVELSGWLADGTPLTAMGDGELIGSIPRVIECVSGALNAYAPPQHPR
ncbi:diacylglycerol/lipid kinase family protein [Propionibacteriaceae bacterium Y2011]